MDKISVATIFLIALILLSKGISSSTQLPGVRIVKILAGFGIPIDLEFESVTMGYVMKSEYFLPPNASKLLVNYLAHPLDLTSRPLNNHRLPRESRQLKRTENKELQQMGGLKPQKINSSFGYDSVLDQKYEKYVVNAVEVESGSDSVNSYGDNHSENDKRKPYRGDNKEWTNYPNRREQTQNFATARWFLYKGIAALAESKGLDGRSCVLRSICESAHASFDYTNGILGELMHVIMTPSLTKDELSNHSDNEYLRAEELGEQGAPCDKIFKECTTSILDQFSGIITPMMNVFKML